MDPEENKAPEPQAEPPAAKPTKEDSVAQLRKSKDELEEKLKTAVPADEVDRRIKAELVNRDLNDYIDEASGGDSRVRKLIEAEIPKLNMPRGSKEEAVALANAAMKMAGVNQRPTNLTSRFSQSQPITERDADAIPQEIRDFGRNFGIEWSEKDIKNFNAKVATNESPAYGK